MTYEQAVKYFGSLPAMARVLGDLPKSTVHSWKRRGHIPWQYQYDIEISTAGRLKADKRNGR